VNDIKMNIKDTVCMCGVDSTSSGHS